MTDEQQAKLFVDILFFARTRLIMYLVTRFWQIVNFVFCYFLMCLTLFCLQIHGQINAGTTDLFRLQVQTVDKINAGTTDLFMSVKCHFLSSIVFVQYFHELKINKYTSCAYRDKLRATFTKLVFHIFHIF